MKVKNLIENLKKHDPEAIVHVLWLDTKKSCHIWQPINYIAVNKFQNTNVFLEGKTLYEG